MKTFAAFLAVFLVLLNLSAAENKKATKKADPPTLPAGTRELKIGGGAPDFALPGIDGKTHRLADFKGAKLLMIAFISNHCPDSHASEGRIKKLVADLQGRSFALDRKSTRLNSSHGY